MRSKSEYPTRHGDQHLADGSDPVVRDEIGFYEVVPVGGNPISAGATNPITMSFSFGGGDAGYDLLDLGGLGAPTGPVFKTAGMYAVLARVVFGPEPAGTFPMELSASMDMYIQNELAPANDWAQQATQTFPLDNAFKECVGTVGFVRFFKKGDSFPPQFFQLLVARTSGLALNVIGAVSVQRIFGPQFRG